MSKDVVGGIEVDEQQATARRYSSTAGATVRMWSSCILKERAREGAEGITYGSSDK
jgi:hypothetical protein